MSKNVLYLLDNPQCCVFTAFNEDFAKYANSSTSNLFAEVDSSIKTCVFMKQSHSNKVLLVDDIHKQYECDGLLSFDKNIALCVLSADCLPLVLWHKSGIIAALHSGRKGSFENILKESILLIQKHKNVDISEFNLFIGPAICAKNYEISGEVLEYARQNFSEFLSENKLDLKALIKFQAKEVGIENIIDSGICTFDDERFFSYRKDKTKQRFVTVVYLKA